MTRNINSVSKKNILNFSLNEKEAPYISVSLINLGNRNGAKWSQMTGK